MAGPALEQAIAAGDRELALRIARRLRAAGSLPVESRLLLLAEAVRTRKWKQATSQLDHVAEDQLLGSLAPIIEAWLARGSGRGDPLVPLNEAAANPITASFAAGHRRLIEGEAGKPRLSAAAGIAHLLVELAAELQAGNMTAQALIYARLATFAAPDSGQAWLTVAQLLGLQDRHDAALAALGRVRPEDPAASAAKDMRMTILIASKRPQQAFEEAQRAARAPQASTADRVRLAEVLAASERHEEAAQAFADAIARRGKDEQDPPEWAIRVQHGASLIEAGRWPEARQALEAAYRLAPEEPHVLNYLGYSLLERRERMDEAEKLIAEASRLKPDDAAITDSLGWAYYLRGKLEPAIELLEKAAKAEPDDATINEHLGDAYYSAGRRFEARYAWQAALLTAEGKAAERLRAKIEVGLTPQLTSP